MLGSTQASFHRLILREGRDSIIYIRRGMRNERTCAKRDRSVLRRFIDSASSLTLRHVAAPTPTNRLAYYDAFPAGAPAPNDFPRGPAPVHKPPALLGIPNR